jgi:hypothetical protein
MFAGYAPEYVTHVATNVADIKTNIARNAQEHAANVATNAGKWLPENNSLSLISGSDQDILYIGISIPENEPFIFLEG